MGKKFEPDVGWILIVILLLIIIYFLIKSFGVNLP